MNTSPRILHNFVCSLHALFCFQLLSTTMKGIGKMVISDGNAGKMAERMGFEPTMSFHPYSLSRGVSQSKNPFKHRLLRVFGNLFHGFSTLFRKLPSPDTGLGVGR